jgi:phosphoglycerate dehydrogenase-like enzyme
VTARPGLGKTVLVVANMRRDVPGWPEAVALLTEAGFSLEDDGRELSSGELKTKIAHADAVLVGGTHLLGADALRSAHRLRIVSRQGVGVDNIDVATAAELGIPVCNTAGSNADAVADHTLALMLGLMRQLLRLDAATRSGQGWRAWPPQLEQLAGKTIGVVGTGNIGRRVARRAAAGFGMRVLAHDIRHDPALVADLGLRYAPLREVVEVADVLSLHVPLDETTRNLIDKEVLKLMKPTSLLINTARGGVVDELALAAALREGRLAGAGIDVFEIEPMVESPFNELDNVILTPHAAGQSPESSAQARLWAAENIIGVFTGTLRNVVNGAQLRAQR